MPNRERIIATKFGEGYTARSRRAVLLALGQKCAQCGYDDPRAVQIDHVNDDGATVSTRKRNGARQITSTDYHRMLVEIQEGSCAYQLLCANCNQVKRYNGVDADATHASGPQLAFPFWYPRGWVSGLGNVYGRHPQDHRDVLTAGAAG